jgi:putative phosphoesterase
MRVAVVSDIHGNLTAFEAVLADLRDAAPDLVLHGGDLANAGSSPSAVVDLIRELGWPGVVGNGDEMLFRPASLEEYAATLPHLDAIWKATREMATVQREALGGERLDWLGRLPLRQTHGNLTVVHAGPGDCWRSPHGDSGDEQLQAAYGVLGAAIVVYGHIHSPFVRRVGGTLVINSGSVSLSYDGDPRAAYLLLDDAELASAATATIRRVEYDVEKEIRAAADAHLPHAEWMARMLRDAAPSMP